MADSRFFSKAGEFSLKELAAIGGCELVHPADGDVQIVDVSTLDQAGVGEISFLSNSKYIKAFQESKAEACIIAPEMATKAPAGMKLLTSKDPYKSYAKIAAAFYPAPSFIPEISDRAVISDRANIGADCYIGPGAVIEAEVEIGSGSYIGPNCYIGQGVKIGENAKITANCNITHTIIGKNLIMHPGCCVGQDGFGFVFDAGSFLKVPQLGRVIIGNFVEIGASTCIDRGASGDTIIGDQTKIDNLVQLGHNVVLGRGCIIVSQVGIAGSAHIGDFVQVGGQVGIAGHLHIGSGVKIAAQSGVHKDLAAGGTYGGSPVTNIMDFHRQTVFLNKMIKTKSRKSDEQ